jgi:hypothetical protein
MVFVVLDVLLFSVFLLSFSLLFISLVVGGGLGGGEWILKMYLMVEG